MESAFRDWLNAKQRGYLTFLGTLVAEAKLDMGRREDALNLLEEVEQLALETHQQLYIPELHRLRAEALRRLDARHSGIEPELRKALNLAHEQGALSLELRAATGLAQWLSETKRHTEGQELIRPVYGRFTEGFATPDLNAARAMIDGLA